MFITSRKRSYTAGGAKGPSVRATLFMLLLFMAARLSAQQQQPAAELGVFRAHALDVPDGITAYHGTQATSGEGSAIRYENPKDDRIFKVMPNYQTVEGTPTVPPLNSAQKWKMATRGAFDPFEFALSGLLAGASQAANDQSSFGQGAAGYGKRYGEAFANQAIGDFLSGAVFPTLLRQDPRYFQLGKGTFRHRIGYALSRVFLTPADSGRIECNYSELLGNAAASGIANAYNSPEDRTASNTAVNFGEQLAFDMMGNELREFWPDIRRKFFRTRTP